MANLVVLKGRMTRDVEMRYTQGAESKAYCMFSVAVNRMKQGEADFINCKAWGKTAELIAQHFTKGKEIYLQGRIEVTTSGEGENKRTYTNVVADRVDTMNTQSPSVGAPIPPTAEEKKTIGELLAKLGL